MLISLFFAASVLSPVQEAMPSPLLPRWVVIGTSEKGEHAIDLQTVRRDGDRVRAFTRVRLTEDDGKTIIGVVEYEYDCKANTSRRLQIGLFNADGTQRSARAYPLAEQVDRPIDLDSPNAEIAKHACRHR